MNAENPLVISVEEVLPQYNSITTTTNSTQITSVSNPLFAGGRGGSVSSRKSSSTAAVNFNVMAPSALDMFSKLSF